MKKYSADAAPSGITQEYREPKRKKRKKGTDPTQGDATIRIIDTDVSGFGSRPRLPPTSFSDDDDEPEDDECELIHVNSEKSLKPHYISNFCLFLIVIS